MEIKIKPKIFTGDTYWRSKVYGVVLVEKEEDIEPLFQLLCEQDSYWEYYKKLIKVAPKEIDSIGDLSELCDYCGKTDIYELESLQEKIPFIIYQEAQSPNCSCFY